MYDFDIVECIIFESDVQTYNALLNYYNKQLMIQEYSEVVMEDGEKKSFIDKLKNAWKHFLFLLKKFCQRITILIKKIKRTRMVKAIRDKFNELKESHNRKKYDIPKKDFKLKNPDITSKADHVREDILQNIDIENQTIKTFLVDYKDIDKRILIQYDLLEDIDHVLDKYMRDKKYSMIDAEKELCEKNCSRYDEYRERSGGDAAAYYYFSNGFYNNAWTRYSKKDFDKDPWLKDNRSHMDVSKSDPIPWSEYISRFETLERHLSNLDDHATRVANRIETLLKSTYYKDDIIIGGAPDFDHYKDDKSELRWDFVHSQSTRRADAVKPSTDSPNKHRDAAGKIFDENSMYGLSYITAHLSYSMNYITSIYVNMKIEYDTIMSIKPNTGEGDTA